MKKEVQREVGIGLVLERSRLNREKGTQILNKSMFIYFCFLFVAVMGSVNGYLNHSLLSALMVLGITALTVGAMTYALIMRKEERNLDRMLASIRTKRCV